MDTRPRPEVGTVTRYEIKVPICRLCGYKIDSVGCAYGCLHDGPERDPENMVIAVYGRVDTFLRDERP